MAQIAAARQCADFQEETLARGNVRRSWGPYVFPDFNEGAPPWSAFIEMLFDSFCFQVNVFRRRN
jgi:hypothetical protein